MTGAATIGPVTQKGSGRVAASSRFRGVTRHRRSGRWEAHLWVKDLAKQIYLGAPLSLRAMPRRLQSSLSAATASGHVATLAHVSMETCVVLSRKIVQASQVQTAVVNVGGFESEEQAAEAYDVAVLKSKGKSGRLNFGLERYTDLLGCMDNVTLEELIMIVRRQSQAFSRGSSVFRGVTRHPRCPRHSTPWSGPTTRPALLQLSPL